MTKKTEGFPGVYPKGYTVSRVEYTKEGKAKVVYDFNTDGSLCDVYVVDNISCMNIDPLTHLRTFIVNEKKGRIYCERINVSRYDQAWSAVMTEDIHVQIILWTNEHVYNVWNDINDRLVKDFGMEEDEYGILPEHIEGWLFADLHPGWYIPDHVVRQEVLRAHNARRDYDPAEMKMKFGSKCLSNSSLNRYIDCFRIVQVRAHNMQCITKEATGLRQLCAILKKWMKEEEDMELVEDDEHANMFSFFVFWPKSTDRKFTIFEDM
jgi:hypothetical protein